LEVLQHLIVPCIVGGRPSTDRHLASIVGIKEPIGCDIYKGWHNQCSSNDWNLQLIKLR